MVLYLKTNVHFLTHISQFFLELKKFKKKCREIRNTHFIFNTFFLNRTVYEIMWKNFVNRDWPPVGRMAHAHCMLGL
jgi:hypothetical protein